MISSFEVGAVFKIINEASPALTRILNQVRELTKAVEKARISLAEITKGVGTGTGLTAAIGETDRLAASWKRVAVQAGEARAAMVGASGSVRLPAPSGGGGSGGAHQPRWLGGGGGGGGGVHYSNPAISSPTGTHFRVPGAIGAAAAAVAYGGYQAAGYEDAAVMMAQHAGVDYKSNRERFEKILKDATMTTGYSEHDVSEAAQDVLRQFKYTGGEGGVEVLPQILRYGSTEARLKGTGLKESESAMVGLAHMLKKYSAADVEKLAPAFSVLSVANPMTLHQMDTAFGYAVPLLQSGMDLDPFQTMAASTALARSGIRSTKAGTWVRQMMKGAMPGTSLMSKMVYKKHEEALKELDLVDDHHKPTWFVDGKPDEFNFLKKISEKLPQIPVARRAAVLQALAGTQGAGALAVLGEPAVQDQMQRIWAATQDPAEIARVRNFSDVYGQNSTKQNSRQSLQTFNVLMADIGDNVLPSVNVALGNFKGAIESVRSVLPGASKDGSIGGAFLTGALPGLGIGIAGGPLLGAAGFVGGGVMGVAAQYMHENGGFGIDKAGTFTSPGKTGHAAQPKTEVKMQTNINLDGRTLASAIGEYLIEAMKFSTVAPEAGGMSIYNSGGE